MPCCRRELCCGGADLSGSSESSPAAAVMAFLKPKPELDMVLLGRVAFGALKASCRLMKLTASLSSPQEETVAELRTVESEAASYLDQISR